MTTQRTGRGVLAGVAVAAAFAVLAPAPANAAYTHQVTGNTLTLTGDDASDELVVSRNAAGVITYAVTPGTFQPTGATVTGTGQIVVDARGGGDGVVIDQTAGPMPSATINGGDGDDRLAGGFGQDTIDGGGGNDTIDPGDDNDQVTGGSGDDRILWDPGDDSDTIDGEGGRDLHVFNANSAIEVMTLTSPSAGALRLTRNVGGVNQSLRGIEHIRVPMAGGFDTFTADDNLAATGLETLEVDLGENDPNAQRQVFNGSDVQDIGSGATDRDNFDGAGGDDIWRWTPGQNRDSLSGGDGLDRLAVTGTDAFELFHAENSSGPSIDFAADEPHNENLAAVRFEALSIDFRGGDDRFLSLNDLGTIASVDISGGEGNDVIEASGGADILRGGPGDDSLFARGGDDQLFGDAGTDELSGGQGKDSFACGGLGDVFDATPDDTVAADCLKPADPPAPQPEQPQQPGGPEQPQQPQGLPAGFLGFGAPKLKATGGGLSVTLKNTHSAPIRVLVGATEKASRRGKALRYRAKTKTIAPGKRATIALKAPRAVQRLIARSLRRSGRIVRKPTVTIANVDTGGKRTIKPKVTLVQR